MPNIYFVGHKVQDMGGFGGNVLQNSIYQTIEKTIRSYKSCTVLTSLDLGIETWAAEIARVEDVPYMVYTPCINFESNWINASAKNYRFLKAYAETEILFSEQPFNYKNVIANREQIVLNSDIVYSFYRYDTRLVNFARKNQKQVINLLPQGELDDFFIPI